MRYTHPENKEPTVSVEVDGNNYTFTTQSLIDTIKKDEAYRAEIAQLERKLLSLKYDVKAVSYTHLTLPTNREV